MKQIPIEDFFEDILKKAQRGRGFSDQSLAAKSGIGIRTIQSLKAGNFEEEPLRKIAPVLKLDADSLVASGRKEWYPRPVDLAGLAVFNTPYHDIFVNAYLIWDTDGKNAIAFDTGADAAGMLETIRKKDLNLEAIFLTHTHGDHILQLDSLGTRTGSPPVFVHEREAIAGSITFVEGESWDFGALGVRALHTHGHSSGGTTYVVSGLEKPIAIVGDAIFAGSMGGGMISFQDAITTNREKILTLSEDTILCPGHGPLTTVAEEKAHNPFFPEFKKQKANSSQL